MTTRSRAVLALGENDIGRGETGLAALKLFRDDLPSWRQKEDPAWLASYVSRTIEVFGNGGGNFRRMYAAFLAEARAMLPDLVDPGLPRSGREIGRSVDRAFTEPRQDREAGRRGVLEHVGEPDRSDPGCGDRPLPFPAREVPGIGPGVARPPPVVLSSSPPSTPPRPRPSRRRPRPRLRSALC